jgi:lambda repressor-like predicted transcriptional regulator
MSSMSISGTQQSGGMNMIRGMRPPRPPAGGGGGGGGGGGPIDSVKDVLKLSTDEITKKLQSGESLNDIAKDQGVDHDMLISALKAGMPSDLAQTSDADKIAESIAAQTGLQGPRASQSVSAIQGVSATQSVDGVQSTDGTQSVSGHHHHHHGHGSASQVGQLDGSMSGVLSGALTQSQQKTLDSLSSLLGTDSTSLMTSLKNGTSLADLVSQSGVDSSKLAGILQDGLMVDTRS